MNEDTTKLSRRNFFKAGTVLASGVAIASTLAPYDGLLFAAEAPGAKGKWYGIGIDINKWALGRGRDRLHDLQGPFAVGTGTEV